MEWLSHLVAYPWWYYVLAIILGGIGFVGFVFYRGYSRVRPKPLKGVPSPPLTHSLLGHPEGMVHPLKHDIRLQFSENFPYALYQLSLMNHNAIFVNDPVVAAEIIDTLPTKGPIYGAYRYDQSLPDILASDGEAFQLRQKYLSPAFQSVQLPDLQSDAMTQSLLQYFATSFTQEEANVDLKRLYTLFSLDVICNHYFHYQLDAVNGSTQGDRLYSALTILYDAAATNGIYSFPNARKITPEEINESKDTWRNFLHTIYQHIQQQVKEYESEHTDSELLHQSRVDHALVYLQRQQPEIIHEEEMINEIHQILRHGHESIVASLLWMTYALYRNKRVREIVEKAILQHQQTNEPLTNDNYPEYLENFLKELLRRYPALGNMTVRTVNQDVLVFAGIQIPRGSPLHMHMYSLQNTARNWVKPKEFLPERWFETPTTPSDEAYEEIKGNYPKCPFLAASKSEGRVNVYEGVGFQENAISYFPFSAGERICAGRQFALQVLRKVLYDVSRQYRLEAVDGVNESDVGISLHTVIVPSNEKSTTVRVVKIENLKDLVENGDKILSDKVNSGDVKEEIDEGWAEDNDFDFVERKQQD